MSGTANRVVPVTSPPVQVSGVYGGNYLVINVGQSTVYLGQNSSVSTINYGVPLTPGSNLKWSGDSELWAVCESGETSSLSILYTADSSFTPAPSNVNVSGQVISSGELVDLGEISINLPSGAVTDSGSLSSIDVSLYNSLFIQLDDGNVFPGLTALVETNYVLLQVTQENSSRASAAIETIAQYLLGRDYSDSWLEIPVRGNLARVAIVAYKTTGNETLIRANIYGSMREVNQVNYSSGNSLMIGDLGFYSTSRSGSSGSVNRYLKTINGKAYVFCSSTGAGKSTEIRALVSGSPSSLIVAATTSAGDLFAVRECAFPLYPIRANVVNPSAGNSEHSITQ